MSDDAKSNAAAAAKQKKAAKKKDKKLADQATLLMSGLRTEKEKLLAQHLSAQIKRTNQKDSDIKTLNTRVKELEKKIEKIEKSSKKSRDAVYKEQKLRTSAISDQHRIKAAMAKIQKAVSARLKLLGIDFDKITSIGEALDASLRAINSLVAQLGEKDALIAKMEKEMEELKKTIEKQKNKIAKLSDTISKQKGIISELKEKLKDRDAKIDKLNYENKELKKQNKELQAQLDILRDDYKKLKEETDKKFDEMAKTILDSQQENVEKQSKIDELLAKISQLENDIKNKNQIIQDQSDEIKRLKAIIVDRDNEINDKNNKIKELEDEIERLKKIIEELMKKGKEQRGVMDDQSAKIKALQDAIANKDDELNQKNQQIAQLNDEIDKLRAEIERLLAIINKPKSSTECQTDITGDINQKLSDYPRLLKEIVALKQLLEKKNKRIKDLEEENKLLMADLQYLLKRAVCFYSDRSPHHGQVWQMKASPKRYIIATGATDMTIRLWKVNPDADKTKGQKMTSIFKCARIDGKIDSIAWSSDGKLLGAGTGYRDGADGFVVVWSMDGPSQYEVVAAIRSRPTLRFGRTYALCFNPSATHIYCGDTVGSIWCINLESERIVGLIKSHTDIVYDVMTDPSGMRLFSVSLDKTLAVIILPDECGGVKGTRSAYLALKNNDNDIKTDDDNNNNKKLKSQIKDIKRKSTKKKDKKNKNNKKQKHIRARSSSNAKKNQLKNVHQQYASMTLKELLDQEINDEYLTYDGITLIKDDSYGFWKVVVSSDGQFVVCATRKIQIYKITGKDTVIKGSNIMDLDNDHVRSLHVKNSLILTSRVGCPTSRFFNLNTGKEFKKIKCKRAVAQSVFLCDDAFAAVLTQELIPNQAPKTPSMKLFQYNKDKKSNPNKEPQTPITVNINSNSTSPFPAVPPKANATPKKSPKTPKKKKNKNDK